jgi:transglutaminase-like putative cysteine protease
MSLLRRRALSCVVLLAVLGGFAIAQDKASAPWQGSPLAADPKAIALAAAAIRAEPDAEATVLTDERVVTLDATDRATMTTHRVYRVESKEAFEWAGTVKASWYPWRQTKPEVRARVIARDGTAAVLDAKVLSDSPVHDQQPEIYEDQRSLSGPLPSIEVGSIVEVETVVRDTAPLFAQGTMRRYNLITEDAVLHSSLEIHAPSTLALRYKLRGAPSVAMTRKEENGVVTLSFEQQATGSAEPNDKDLPADFDAHPAIDYSTAESWSVVANAYYQLIADAIRPKQVEALLEGTRGLQGQELLRRVVTNLHHKVRYTGLEFGASALVPHAAGETLKSGYGDCKDKAVVLVSALQAAGIPAQIALLDTRGDDDVTPELAGMGMFDHAIVFVPGSPGTWIDATAEFHEPGDLPWDDQGRLALLIGPETRELVRTPLSTPAQNAHIVRREFDLAEYGPAKIVETFEPVGDQAAYMRSHYGQSDTKEKRDELDNHVRNTFLAENLGSVEHSSGVDLTKRFQMKMVVNKGRRGFSDLDSAVVAIRPENLMWGYPDYVLDDDGTDKSDKPGWRPRKDDIETQPFVTEWRYRIVPPPGSGAPVLPKNSEQNIGPAKLAQQYKVESDGTVTAIWRFDSVKARYTPAELQALRRDAHSFLNADAVFINIPQQGAALLAEGKSREALAAYTELAKLHSDKAIYRVRVAKVLLAAGFGEEARKEALRATQLDAKNALAWDWLAWTRQHDAIGRRLGKGFDLDGSVARIARPSSSIPKSGRTTGISRYCWSTTRPASDILLPRECRRRSLNIGPSSRSTAIVPNSTTTTC